MPFGCCSTRERTGAGCEHAVPPRIAFGSLDDVERLIGEGAPLEAKDWWGRTPWLLAIHEEISRRLNSSFVRREHEGVRNVRQTADDVCRREPPSARVALADRPRTRCRARRRVRIDGLMAAAESSEVECLAVICCKGGSRGRSRAANGEHGGLEPC